MPVRRSLPYMNVPAELRQHFKALWDQIDLVQGATSTPAWRGSVNAAGYPLQGLAPGTQDTDAVTVKQLMDATSATKISASLSSGGAAPLNVTNLIGAGGTLTAGTHAERLATPATPGNFFFE